MVEIIITSSILILALLLLRKACWGKISRRLQYGLWLLVAFRLLVPAQLFTSSLSIMNLVETAGEAAWVQWQERSWQEEGLDGLQGDNTLQSDVQQGNVQQGTYEASQDKTEASQDRDEVTQDKNGTLTGGNHAFAGNGSSSDSQSGQRPDKLERNSIARRLLVGIYLTGVLLAGASIVWCNIKFYRQLKTDRKLLGKEGRVSVYLTEHISSPCLFGVPVPAIYVTENALSSEERRKHVLLHEMTHYRHLDHIWAMVRSLCLTLYWFHPLVWIAAKASVTDSELACDEGSFVQLGLDNRKAYGATLIEMTAEQARSSRLLYCATDMTGGKEEIKRRITAIAFYRKQMLGIAVLVVVFAMVLGACTAGAAKSGGEDLPDGSLDSVEVRGLQLGDGLSLNADGSIRLSEYQKDLTGDRVNERIVFDVLYYPDPAEADTVLTRERIKERLWSNADISVKVLQGQKDEDGEENKAAEKETVLASFDFSGAHAGNGNLAVVSHSGEWCLMEYENLLYQGQGNFGYRIWQFLPSGKEPVLLEEMNASYAAADGTNNTTDTVLMVKAVCDKMDEYLFEGSTKILLNASMDSANCYLYDSSKGAADESKRQNAFEVFMAEVGESGYELALEDYFYPNGTEPLTKLPENTEARILNGEIICMEISAEHKTAGRLDLDGDGEKEVLFLEAVGSSYYDDGWSGAVMDVRYRVRVKNTAKNTMQSYESYCDNLNPVLMAYSPDGKQILLAVYDDGPSGDPLTSFLGDSDNALKKVGEIPADLRNAVRTEGIPAGLRDVAIDKNGVICCAFRGDMIQTDFAWGYYHWNGAEIVRRADEVYYYTEDPDWKNAEYCLRLTKEITVYTERSADSDATLMKPQRVRTVATDLKEWVLLEAYDGTRGWFLAVDENGKKINSYDYFEDLNMAG